MLSDIEVLGSRRVMSDEDKFRNFPGGDDGRIVTVGSQTLYLFGFRSSGRRVAEYLISGTNGNFYTQVTWPHLPEDRCGEVGLDWDRLLPGAPYENIETAFMAAKTWEREHCSSLGASWHEVGVDRSGEDASFLRLDTIRNARIGWLDGQKIFLYCYRRHHHDVESEFLVYRAGDWFEVALVQPGLSRADRRRLNMTQDTIGLTHAFGEPCVNLETAIVRSQLWADQNL